MRRNNKIKKISLILIGLLLFAACEQIKVDPDVTFEGIGRLSIHGTRYYVDREGIYWYENKVNLYINGAEPGARVYWSLMDPDDPADHAIIDLNGSFGDDNEGKTSEFYGSVDYDGYDAYSIIDDWGQAECYFYIEPAYVSGSYKYYITGDNFKVRATKDSPDGDVYTESEIFSVWKKIRKIEYDWMKTPPGAVDPMDTDIFYKDTRLFSNLQTLFSDETAPNRLIYIEIEDGSLIDENDPKDTDWNEPMEWSDYPFGYVLDLIDNDWKANDDYVYICSLVRCFDRPDLVGFSRATTADGKNGFSVILWYNLKEVAEDQSLNLKDCVKKVLVHELGHQLANLRDYLGFEGNHTGPDCIMNTSFDNDPYYCPMCVVNFRQYFMTF